MVVPRRCGYTYRMDPSRGDNEELKEGWEDK